MSAYLWAFAPDRLRLALSPIIRRLTLIASLVALITAIAWLALESASMAATRAAWPGIRTTDD
jgi:hypothetical protein